MLYILLPYNISFEKRIPLKKKKKTSLAVQWLGLLDSTAEGTGLIPGWGPKILQATWQGQKTPEMEWTACHWRIGSVDSWLWGVPSFWVCMGLSITSNPANQPLLHLWGEVSCGE